MADYPVLGDFATGQTLTQTKMQALVTYRISDLLPINSSSNRETATVDLGSQTYMFDVGFFKRAWIQENASDITAAQGVNLHNENQAVSRGGFLAYRSSDTNDAILAGFGFLNTANSSTNATDAGSTLVAGIYSRVVTTDANAGDDSGGILAFYTKPEAGVLAEVARFNSAGYLLLGETTGTSIRFLTKAMGSGEDTGISLEHSGNTVKIASIDQENGHGSFRLRNNSGTTNVLFRATDTSYLRGGKFGVGLTTPDSLIHVYNASAGTVTALTGSLLTLEDTSTAYLQFLTANTGSQGIIFGDADDNDASSITYSHSTNNFTFTRATVVAASIDSSGLSVSGGIDAGDNGVYLRSKVLDIGDWNIYGVGGSVNVAHGLSTEFANIRTVNVNVINDSATTVYEASAMISVATNSGIADVFYSPIFVESIDSTNIVLTRRLVSGGVYNSTVDPLQNTEFDSTSYNRGWVTVWYTV